MSNRPVFLGVVLVSVWICFTQNNVRAEALSNKAEINQLAYRNLIKACEGNQTDALVILKMGKMVSEKYFRNLKGPIALKSVTKSIVSLGVGMLLDEKKIRSLDAPISTWYPEWQSGTKSKVTLRHVLEQTTGLKHENADGLLWSNFRRGSDFKDSVAGS